MGKTFTYDRFDIRGCSCDGCDTGLQIQAEFDGEWIKAEDAINREAVLQAEIRTLEVRLKDQMNAYAACASKRDELADALKGAAIIAETSGAEIRDLRERLSARASEAAAGEPVAWRVTPNTVLGGTTYVLQNRSDAESAIKRGDTVVPLYTAPPAAISDREALTKADMIELYHIAREKPKSEWMYIVRAVLAKRRNDSATASDKEGA